MWFVDHKFFVILDEGYGTAEGTVNLNFHLLPGMTPSEVVVDAAENGAHTAFADGNNLLVRTFANKAVTTTARTGYVSLVLDVTTERPSYQVDLAKSAGDQGRALHYGALSRVGRFGRNRFGGVHRRGVLRNRRPHFGDGRRSDLPTFIYSGT